MGPGLRASLKARPLPTREGVGASCVSLPAAGPWRTIAEFLCARFPAQPPQVWLDRMQRALVVDEHGELVFPERPYQPRLRVYYYRSVAGEPQIPFEEVLLFRDAHLAVVDKPHFLPVLPAGRYVQETLLARLKRRLGLDDIVPVHRIDRDTAGLVMFSLQAQTRDAYHGLFRRHAVRKVYQAIAAWRPGLCLPRLHESRLAPGPQFMQQQEVCGPCNARTMLRVLESKGAFARYELLPLTGRRHQLRVHMAALGLPIVGDRIYPRLLPDASPDFTRPLQLLAHALAFTDPLSGDERYFESQRALKLAAAPAFSGGAPAGSPA